MKRIILRSSLFSEDKIVTISYDKRKLKKFIRKFIIELTSYDSLKVDLILETYKWFFIPCNYYSIYITISYNGISSLKITDIKYYKLKKLKIAKITYKDIKTGIIHEI